MSTRGSAPGAGETSSLTFGSTLRRLRESRGLSLGDLAGRVHYSKGHLSRVETGKKRPAMDLASLCDDVLETGGTLSALMETLPSGSGRLSRPLKQLPRVVRDFVDRDEVVAALDGARSGGRYSSPVVLVDGPAGVGKTETVLQWAHSRTDRFPHGILYIDLDGFTPSGRPASPEEVLRYFLHSLGARDEFPETDLRQLTAEFQGMLTDRNVLIVLDNALDPQQVRPLLPSEPGCMAVITSRSRMPGLLARDGAQRVEIPPMRPDQALALFSSLNPRPGVLPRAFDVLEACGHLPLLIRIAAQKASQSNRSFWELLEGREGSALLRLFSVGGDDSTSLTRLLQRSYDHLSSRAARAFVELAALGVESFDSSDVAGLLGIEEFAAAEVVDELVGMHLIRHHRGRFSMDAVHRAFGVEVGSRASVPVQLAAVGAAGE